MIYIIRAGRTNFVKIGRSQNPLKRMADLQYGHYEVLWIVALLPEHRLEIERIIHKEFRRYKVQGEWFSGADKILEFLFPGRSYFPGYPIFWDEKTRVQYEYLEDEVNKARQKRNMYKPAMTLKDAEERDKIDGQE